MKTTFFFTKPFIEYFIKIAFIFCLIRKIYEIIIFSPEYPVEVTPFFTQSKELFGYTETHQNIDIAKSSLVVSDIFDMCKKRFIFNYRESIKFSKIPIVRPIIQLDNPFSGTFLSSPFVSDRTDVNFWIPKTKIVPLDAFCHRFSKSFFLALINSISLVFVLILRQYWIEGFDGGFRRTFGYQLGQTVRLIIIAYGFRPIYRSNYPIFDFIGITTFYFTSLLLEPIILRTIRQKRLYIYPKEFADKNRAIFLRRFICSWTNPRILFGISSSQTFEVQNLSRVLPYFSYGPFVSVVYRIGLFLGGMLFNFCSRILILNLINHLTIKLFRKYRFSDRWIDKISSRTFRIGLAIILSRFSVNGFEYFAFGGKRARLYSRDSRMNALLSRSHPNSSKSLLWEGSNALGIDAYGRSIPDIIREPWILGRLPVETDRDYIDQIQRTRSISMRRNGSFLGEIETIIAQWFYRILFGEKYVRHIISTTGFIFPEDYAKGENKTIPLDKLWDKFDWDDIQALPVPIREDLENVKPLNDTSLPVVYTTDDYFSSYKSEDIYEKDFRAANSDKISELGAVLLITHEVNRNDRLPGFDEDLSPTVITQYTNLNEFRRKRKARNSIVNYSSVLTYMDILLTSQTPIKSESKIISTRQQQRELYVAQHILMDYVSTTRNYLKKQKNGSNPFRNILHQTNNVPNQQYVGNLQFVRRLFRTFWPDENNSIPRIAFIRRKLSLDQMTFDNRINIFEHEELGKTFGSQTKTEKRQIFQFSKKTENNLVDNQNLYVQEQYFPELKVDTKPLYISWDSQARALILCNRFLPIEWYRQEEQLNKNNIIIKTDSPLLLEHLKIYSQKNIQNEFTFWPFNITSNRRMPPYFKRSFSYNTNLHRRISTTDEDIILVDYNFLCHDRRSLFRECRRWDSAAIRFWINPKADFGMEYSIYPKDKDIESDLENDIEEGPLDLPHKQLRDFLIAEDENDYDTIAYGELTDIFNRRFSLAWNQGRAVTFRVSNSIRRQWLSDFNLQIKDFWAGKISPENNKLVRDLVKFKFPNPIISETVRDGKNIPNSFERTLRNQFRTYIPGDIQPTKRSGFVWPGTNSFLFIPKTYFRPFSGRDFRPESELDSPKKNHYIGRL